MIPELYELHLFDLDDTLINTKQAYWFAQAAAVRDAFPDVEPKQFEEQLPHLKWICNVFGSGNVKQYMSAFLKNDPNLFQFKETILDRIVESYQAYFQSQLKCFNGVTAFLDKLLNSDKKIALVSNGSTATQIGKLKTTGLARYFSDSALYISGDFPWELKKPSPFLVTKALNDAGTEADKAVFYGNATVDILAGNLAGVTTVHYSESTALPEHLPAISKPDLIIKNWSDLL